MKQFEFSVAIQNLFNIQWREAQFAGESRLRNEANSIEDIHFTPGAPFNIQATTAFTF